MHWCSRARLIHVEHVLRDKVSRPQGHFDRVFNRGATGQRVGKASAIEILQMCKPRDAVMLMRPVENRKRLLLPDLLRARKPESYNVASQSLVRVLLVGCVPVPLGIPVQDTVYR